jgi:ABC-2 type transport system permease protein
MQDSLVPGWISTVAKFNPVNWAVEAGRSATLSEIDWGLVAGGVGLLAALVLLCAWFATHAFGTYQRSL